MPHTLPPTNVACTKRALTRASLLRLFTNLVAPARPPTLSCYAWDLVGAAGGAACPLGCMARLSQIARCGCCQHLPMPLLPLPSAPLLPAPPPPLHPSCANGRQPRLRGSATTQHPTGLPAFAFDTHCPRGCARRSRPIVAATRRWWDGPASLRAPAGGRSDPASTAVSAAEATGPPSAPAKRSRTPPLVSRPRRSVRGRLPPAPRPPEAGPFQHPPPPAATAAEAGGGEQRMPAGALFRVLPLAPFSRELPFLFGPPAARTRLLRVLWGCSWLLCQSLYIRIYVPAHRATAAAAGPFVCCGQHALALVALGGKHQPRPAAHLWPWAHLPIQPTSAVCCPRQGPQVAMAYTHGACITCLYLCKRARVRFQPFLGEGAMWRGARWQRCCGDSTPRLARVRNLCASGAHTRRPTRWARMRQSAP